MDYIGLLIGLLGIILSFIFHTKARKAEKETIEAIKENKSLSWSELQAGSSDLCKKFRKDFTPDIILTPNLRGGIISELIKDQFEKHIPVFTGQIFWKKTSVHTPEIPDNFQIKTGKWILYIPQSICAFKESKLLIVDDFAMSGDTLWGIKEKLIDHGFREENIKTVSLVTTKVAIDNSKEPDYFWRVNESSDFYFPWGKAK